VHGQGYLGGDFMLLNDQAPAPAMNLGMRSRFPLISNEKWVEMLSADEGGYGGGLSADKGGYGGGLNAQEPARPAMLIGSQFGGALGALPMPAHALAQVHKKGKWSSLEQKGERLRLSWPGQWRICLYTDWSRQKAGHDHILLHRLTFLCTGPK